MGLRLALVDDDPAVLESLEDILLGLGCEVIAFARGVDALDYVEKNRIDAALIDRKMPDVDGLTLVSRIRKSSVNGRIPIAMITGFADADCMRAGFETGVTVFFSKPVNRESLRRVLNLVNAGVQRERRRFLRVPFDGKVGCKSAGGTSMELTAVNVSEQGALLKNAASVSGHNIELTFTLPNRAEPITVLAQVIAKAPMGQMRVKFTRVSADAREAIQEFVKIYQQEHSEELINSEPEPEQITSSQRA